ncbi:MAG: DsbC family protein [Zoogloeaceae bacterium]|jgi:thiol:disulfide interchange protein DsbC|nr:DsbC family protein [Zoogloeaceae bacterium]
MSFRSFSFSRFSLLVLSLVAIFAFSYKALAEGESEDSSEARVRANLKNVIKSKVEHVKKTEYPGLYEVYTEGQLIYTNETASYILAGALFDAKTMRNLTEARMNKLMAIRFSDLPLKQAIKQVRGNGKRLLATFEDPNCGYCKRLAHEIAALDNVTIYVFLSPMLSEDSEVKARQIWCSADRARAWNDWMRDNKTPVGKGDCDTGAVRKNVELAQKLNIHGTPTLFFADGERFPGAAPLAQIEEKMNQAMK